MRKGGPRPPWIDRLRKRAESDPEARERLRKAGQNGAKKRAEEAEEKRIAEEARQIQREEEAARAHEAEQERTGGRADIGSDPDA